MEGTLANGFAGSAQASPPMEAELQALVKGVEMCIAMGIQYLIIEGDCLLLVDSLELHELEETFQNFGYAAKLFFVEER